jgi:hypothetical protein
MWITEKTFSAKLNMLSLGQSLGACSQSPFSAANSKLRLQNFQISSGYLKITFLNLQVFRSQFEIFATKVKL